MTRRLLIAEAAAELRKGERWLRDWLRAHPLDACGQPYYTAVGRTKTFTAADIERIAERMREDTRQCLSDSSLRKRAARRIGTSAAPTSASMLTEVRRLLGKPSRGNSATAGKSRSNVVSMPRTPLP